MLSADKGIEMFVKSFTIYKFSMNFYFIIAFSFKIFKQRIIKKEKNSSVYLLHIIWILNVKNIFLTEGNKSLQRIFVVVSC